MLSLLQAIEYGLYDLVEAKALVGVQDGCVTHFEIAHILFCRVFGQFKGGAAQGVFGLQYLAGDIEGLQVINQVIAELSAVQ